MSGYAAAQPDCASFKIYFPPITDTEIGGDVHYTERLLPTTLCRRYGREKPVLLHLKDLKLPDVTTGGNVLRPRILDVGGSVRSEARVPVMVRSGAGLHRQSAAGWTAAYSTTRSSLPPKRVHKRSYSPCTAPTWRHGTRPPPILPNHGPTSSRRRIGGPTDTTGRTGDGCTPWMCSIGLNVNWRWIGNAST